MRTPPPCPHCMHRPLTWGQADSHLRFDCEALGRRSVQGTGQTSERGEDRPDTSRRRLPVTRIEAHVSQEGPHALVAVHHVLT